ncbi:MAG: ferritin family protein [Phycisphaerales bacterium]|nr:MAG: ferritin family protein [Phycisphaerales bacterium]
MGNASVMETIFNVFEVLQIAERIEHNGAKFYLKTAERFDDPEVRDTCYKLANWKARHEKILAQRRKRFCEKTGEFGTFDPDNYVLSNPQVMAGLAVFATEPGSLKKPLKLEDRPQIFKDAIRRAKQAIVFYDGLKDFTRDPASKDVIDTIIKEEKRHIRLLTEELEQK